MKITANSTFHNNLSRTFVGIKEGRNFRRCPSCGGDCECGFPLAHTVWDTPEGYSVRVQEACYNDVKPGMIEIIVEREEF